ncbi:MAG: hypothetical protein AB7F38_00060 [Piscinibacter sp.]
MRKFIVWFVSGAGLASGVAVVVWAASVLDSKPQELSTALPELPAAEAVLSEVEPIAITDHLAYSALLTSKSQSNVSVQVEASVTEAGKNLYNCSAQAFALKLAGTPERIQYECRSVQKAGVPAGAKVELSIKRVSKLPA